MKLLTAGSLHNRDCYKCTNVTTAESDLSIAAKRLRLHAQDMEDEMFNSQSIEKKIFKKMG